MAARFDGSGGDYLNLTGTMPQYDAFTTCTWIKLAGDRNTYSTFFIWDNTNTARIMDIATDIDGTRLSYYNGSVQTLGSQLTVGTWYHLGMIVSGPGTGDVNIYLNGVLDITSNGVGVGNTLSELRLGEADASGEQLNGYIAAFKVWDAVLTADEVRAEMHSIMPRRLANLFSWYPMIDPANYEIDFSGQGRNLTKVGTPLFVADSPPCAWGVRSRAITTKSAPPPAGGSIPVFMYNYRRKRA